MSQLVDLVRKILVKHTDPNTKTPEVILLGWSNNETISEHLSRYVFASKLIYGVVLDVASGTCYGSSILKRCSASKLVVSVDLDVDLLKYGRMIYGVNCVCADATHLPFKDKCFDSVISLETLEHIEDQKAFLGSIKRVLKSEGMFILSTPNKMYSSPLLPRPLNPYHIKEYYLGTLLKLLNSQGFRVNSIYGGKKVKRLELMRRILGSILKFLFNKSSIKAYLVDDFYYFILHLARTTRKYAEATTLMDPDPNMVKHWKLKTASNIVPCQYFIIIAKPLNCG